MADIKRIAGILIDMGHDVKCVSDHGLIVNGDEFTLFTGKYARFRQNPNLYYFKDDAAAAADFIDDGLRTLVWTQEDIESSLDCEKDKLYFTCQMYQKISEKEIVTPQEAHNLYCLFKESVAELLEEYCKDFGLKYKSFSFYLGRRADGNCSQDNVLQFSTDLILRNPNYIKSVLLHELSHTVYHNHRIKFWELLSGMMAGKGLTPLFGYVNKELFARRKDYYIEVPIIRGGPDDRYIKCVPHYDLFRQERLNDK